MIDLMTERILKNIRKMAKSSFLGTLPLPAAYGSGSGYVLTAPALPAGCAHTPSLLWVALFRPQGSIRAQGRPISPVGLNTGSIWAACASVT